MATITAQAAEPVPSTTASEPNDAHCPPMSPEVRAAILRMEREPHLLDGYGEDDWVAFSGDEIVASGPDHDEVIRTAEQAGKPVTLMVPIMGGIWI